MSQGPWTWAEQWAAWQAAVASEPGGLFAQWIVLVAISVVAGLVIFFATALPLHYIYYVRRREDAARWKCQPKRFLPDRLNREAMRLSTVNMTIGGVMSGTFITYVARGGWTRLYFDWSEYGLAYLLLSAALAFFWSDGWAYYIHRASHIRWAYKAYHRIHHRYVATTPWVTVALHPVELAMQVVANYALLFIIPIYAPMFAIMLVYVLVYNIIDHSGVKFTSRIPWQPSSMFHDDHHRHFHCNFGQHLTFWDRVHGTLRRVDRRYGETVFGGRGDGEGDEFVRY
ncbi:MAG: sterol desaturase family protein [Myxococcales bacterium]|nr:sterol desaturase family protein [Myxococcales bacterium]MCB9753310.1 sterol desaturase family protein [Myxococcales bacterium]